MGQVVWCKRGVPCSPTHLPGCKACEFKLQWARVTTDDVQAMLKQRAITIAELTTNKEK